MLRLFKQGVRLTPPNSPRITPRLHPRRGIITGDDGGFSDEGGNDCEASTNHGHKQRRHGWHGDHLVCYPLKIKIKIQVASTNHLNSGGMFISSVIVFLD